MTKVVFYDTSKGQYCPEEASIDGAVSFGKVDKASYIQIKLFFPRQLS